MDSIENIKADELEKLVQDSVYDHYGLPVVKDSEDNEWAIAMDAEERENAIRHYAEETLWMMGAGRLSRCTGLEENVFEALCGLEEDANQAILIIVHGTCGIEEVMQDILEDADYGEYLSSSNGEEVELACGGYAYLVS